MTDFTKEKPYLMSLDSLVNVFYNLYKTTKKKIEVLLLDSYYMNLIEIWHELANITFNPIKYLVIASENVNIDGIAYKIFIRYLQEKVKNVRNTEVALIDVIKEFNEGDKIKEILILVSLEKNKFEELNSCFDNVAKIIIENNINIEKLLKKELSYKK